MVKTLKRRFLEIVRLEDRAI